MNLVNGYALNPDVSLKPDIKISPFNKDYFAINYEVRNSNSQEQGIHDYLNLRFKNRKFLYTWNGRSALNLALAQLKLSKNDSVTILTTTGNFYISSCVTKEIEKFCSWSRDVDENTKVILVNHEFGFCYDDLEALK